MEKRTFANTGIQISPLGLGTVKLGRNQGVKYPQGFELPSDQAVQQLLSLATELGINLIDTAPAYGLSEARLGQLLPGSRHDWVIESKVGEHFNHNTGESHFDFSAKGMRQSVENSLRRLKTDYLDILLIHSDGDDARILQQEAVLNTLLEMKQAGMLRAIGISSKTVAGGLMAFEMGCDVVMASYNPSYTDELPVLQAAAAQNKGILIKKALASGHLDKLGGSHPIQHAFECIFAQPGVSSIVLGTINPQHLQDNVHLAETVLDALKL